MAGITQTVPSFALGISEQPDHLKFPGQVTNIINAIPDVTKGLLKDRVQNVSVLMRYQVYKLVDHGFIISVMKQRDHT